MTMLRNIEATVVNFKFFQKFSNRQHGKTNLEIVSSLTVV
jgi:hypothetical protein